ncbi:MAG: hypothetical protein ACFFDU_01075 [Candidatus Thorarchaeota archaeon]
MVRPATQQVFTDLEFYLWRIRYAPDQEWHPEIMVMASEKTLYTMQEAVTSMITDFKQYGESTRKFLCNPPEDIDAQRYAKENNAEIEWLIWLILRMHPESPPKTKYELKNKAVTVFLDEQEASELLGIIGNQLNLRNSHFQGQAVPKGLYFTRDWLGAKK